MKKITKISICTGILLLSIMISFSCDREERRRAEEERTRRESFCNVCDRYGFRCFYEKERCGCAEDEFVFASNYFTSSNECLKNITGNCGKITKDHYILSESEGLVSPFLDYTVLEIDTTGLLEPGCKFERNNLMRVFVYRNSKTYNRHLGINTAADAHPIIIDMDKHSHEDKYHLKGSTGDRYYLFPFAPFNFYYGFSKEEGEGVNGGSIMLRNGTITVMPEKAILELDFYNTDNVSELFGTGRLVYTRSN